MKKNSNKIAFIANGFGLSPVLSGGEIRLFHLINHSSRLKSKTLITTSGGATAAGKFFGRQKPWTVRVKTSLLLKKEFTLVQRFLNYFISAGDTLKKLKGFDAVYTSSDFFCDVNPAYGFKKEIGKKWFQMIHHKYENPFKRSGNLLLNSLLYLMQRSSFRKISKRADVVFVLDTDEGKAVEGDLRKLGYKNKIYKIKNGIDLGSTVNGQRPTKNKDKNLATFVGGLRPAKGLYDIVPVWEKVVANNPKLRLNVIGQGFPKYMKELRSAIKERGLEKNIKLLGYVDNHKLSAYLNRSFLLFFPSREEGWGISVLEALLHNNHALVYDLPAYKNFKKELITVPCFDHNKFAEKILKTFKNKKIKATKKSFISQYDWKILSKKEELIILRNL